MYSNTQNTLASPDSHKNSKTALATSQQSKNNVFKDLKSLSATLATLKHAQTLQHLSNTLATIHMLKHIKYWQHPEIMIKQCTKTHKTPQQHPNNHKTMLINTQTALLTCLQPKNNVQRIERHQQSHNEPMHLSNIQTIIKQCAQTLRLPQRHPSNKKNNVFKQSEHLSNHVIN